MKNIAILLLHFASIHSPTEPVKKAIKSDSVKAEITWIDSQYVLKNLKEISPSIGEGICKFIENCSSNDIDRFNHMLLPLNKNGGDFNLKIDSIGKYSGAKTYSFVSVPEFDEYFNKALLFKSKYRNSELHGVYAIDSSEKITEFRILAQRLPDAYRPIKPSNENSNTPPLKLISKAGSLIPFSNRTLEQVEHAIISSSSLTHISREAIESQCIMNSDVIVSISPIGKAYAIRMLPSSEVCDVPRHQFMQKLKSIDFGVDSFGVQNLLIHVQSKSDSLFSVKAKELMDLPLRYWVPIK